MNQPLRVGWQALRQHPGLVVVPIAWDALIWLLILATGRFQGPPPGTIPIKAVLPGTLPSGLNLLGLEPRLSAGSHLNPMGMLVSLLLAIGSAMVTAGFLHLLTGAVSGLSPTWDRFVDGVNRYTGRLLLWNLITLAVGLVVVIIAAAGPLGFMLGLIAFVVLVAFALVPFVIVLEDLGLGDAIATAPERLRAHFGALLLVVLATLAVSFALSAFLATLASSGLIVQTALAIGLWSWFGTWTTLAVMTTITTTHVES